MEEVSSKRKKPKTLPSISRLRKGSLKQSKSRFRKPSFQLEVDIVDFMAIKSGKNKGNNPNSENCESFFLDFVDSCEEMECVDIIETKTVKRKLRNSDEFVAENLEPDQKLNNSDCADAEIVVVETHNTIVDLPDEEENVTDFENDVTDLDFKNDGTNLDLLSPEPFQRDIKDKFVTLREGNRTIVVLAHPVEICFKGKSTIQTLLGSCEILGYEFNPTQKTSYEVVSANSNSHLTIKTKNGVLASEIRKAVRNVLSTSSIDKLLENVSKLTQGKCVVIICERLISPLYDYITTCPNFKDIFKMEEKKVSYTFSMVEKSKSLVVSSSQQMQMALHQWTNSINEHGSPVVMVVGGKNSGKSTLNRILVNSALNLTNCVSFFDCDIGQSEFTPSGFISLHQLTEPIFGPPFSHQYDSDDMCFYGEINPGKGLTRYIKTVKFIYDRFKEHKEKSPLIVNTLGWNEGLGQKIAIDLIHMIRPNIIIQLNCEYNYNNFPVLTPEFLTSTSGWLYNTTKSTGSRTQFRDLHLVTVDSEVPTKLKQFYKAPQYRELALLSYLNRGLNVARRLFHVEPYKIDFKDIVVHNVQNPTSSTHILYSLNASVVGLCRADLTHSYTDTDSQLKFVRYTPICCCAGLGVVRCIDMTNRCLYLTTPVSKEKLTDVNLIVKGAIHLPDSMYTRQDAAIDSVNQELPYLGRLKKTIGSSSLVVRSKMPRKHYVNTKV